jgi:DNA-binding MarR family transcriptional regulator
MALVVEIETSDGVVPREACAAARELLPTSDLNWLLHRTAQRFGDAMDRAAQRQGSSMRAHLVLSALIQQPGRTQLSLGAALGLDKTTLTSLLDRMERHGLVVRRPDPTDRRVRIPEVTEAGRALHQRVTPALRAVEIELLGVLSESEREVLRGILQRLGGASVDPPAGSCF